MALLARVRDIFKGGSSAKRKKLYHNVKLENPEEYWEIIGELGDGAYGKVFKSQHIQTKSLAALKQVALESDEDLESFMIEIDILAEFKHPNVVELLEAYHYDGKLWMYLEYCDGGAVDSIMVDLDRALTEHQIAYLCKNLCQALSYIHANKVIHRDLKAGNVLLTLDGGVKLADFGVSAKNKNTYDKRGTFIGTPYWLAPEVILCETFIDAKYDYKADIWSLGISLIEFAQMDPPNHEVSPVRVMLKIQKSDPPKLDYPSKWSKEFNDFVSKCLVKDPLLRPNSEELLKHPFLTQKLDVKPIKELLLEYKAEVVEEEFDDENEENDSSRSGNSIYSQFDRESVLPSGDKSNLNDSDKLPSPSHEDHKDVGQIISPERRVSKGPAPKPPSTQHHSTPKKGPAPSVPFDTPTTPTDSSPAADVKLSPVSVSPVTPEPSIESPHINSSIINTPMEISPPVGVEEPTTTSGTLIAPSKELIGVIEDQKDNEQVEVAEASVKEESSVINVTINSQKVGDDRISEVQTLAPHNGPTPSAVVNIVSDHETSLSSNEFDLSSIPVPVTFSVLPSEDEVSMQKPLPTSQLEPVSSSSSDVVIASISSEGTVIVRTPTPTLPSDLSQDAQKSENVVTYSVPEECEMNAPTYDESVGHEGSSSLAEAEAQAVYILETAIDSAMDAVSSPPTSLVEDIQSTDVKGEIVVVGTERESDSPVDIKAHKLDESEVMISDSSILQDEPGAVEEGPSSRFEVTLEDTMEASAIEAHVSVINVEENNEEDVPVASPSSEETLVMPPPTQPTQILPSASLVSEKDQKLEVELQPMSLTIEGTTIEATDVDDLDSSSNLQQPETKALSTSSDSGFAKDSPTHLSQKDEESSKNFSTTEPKPIVNGVRRNSSSRASDRSDTDTTSTIGSDKENRSKPDDVNEAEVILRVRKPKPSLSDIAKNQKNKEQQESLALRKKTRKRTRKFVIDGVTFTTTTSKVIYGDDEESGTLSSAHLARKQELRELKIVQRQEQKQFQELAVKAAAAKLEQEKKFEIEKANLIRNYDSQLENTTRQQKQMVEKAESRQESELKVASKKIRNDQEKQLKAFRESQKQEWKLLKQELDLVPKDRRKETQKIRKEHLEKEQAENEKAFLERLNESHESDLKRLNDNHRKHIALKERQFLEEKHQLLRARESALWDMEERQIQDKHQLAKEQLKDIYFLQRYQMAIRHNVEQEQVKRLNQHKEDELLKRQQVERKQLPKRIRQEMRTREKMFREQMRISMTTLASHEDEKDQIKKFQEQEKIKYDKERKRAEMKHQKQLEELRASSDASIKELIHLQNEKGKLLTEHESYKLKSLDEDYHKELKEWKANLAPRKQKLEEGFDRQLNEQEKFYGDYLDSRLGLSSTPSQSSTSLTRAHHS